MSTPTLDTEGRKHPRFTVDVDAKVQSGRGVSLGARTRDLSRTGICLITNDSLSRGDTLSIELVLAFGQSAFSEPLLVTAKVVWCTAIAGAFQIGALFGDMTEQQEGYLDMFLQFLDGTLAPRGVPGADDDLDIMPPGPDETDDPFKG